MREYIAGFGNLLARSLGRSWRYKYGINNRASAVLGAGMATTGCPPPPA